ncbi:CARM1 [Cordylochernes scorpioides]|uniref:type I protein arginine methyltransferase n=1 Tax=Cordylochernes scorpioides TaxID=51811 RepID=A0ABY6LGZ2_9ARAC|nr:CARM1 [Cordylochernes scorpioides]
MFLQVLLSEDGNNAVTETSHNFLFGFGPITVYGILGLLIQIAPYQLYSSRSMVWLQFYGYLSQQQNMMQDYIRTSTYQRAIHSNLEDFKDKVVLDVGAGSGILSFFAEQAGARTVYAVEASSMARHAESLVFHNKKSDRIVVVPGKIEEITLPELVDVIISEPMGYMLFNERMLETYLHAKKWLKPEGKMFPTQGDLHIAPFNDASLFMEQHNKANFWFQNSFHGVDLSSLRDVAAEEYFKQPIVDTFDIRICTAKSVRHTVDFLTAHETDLHRIEIPLQFHILQTGDIHGLAFWFDVAFIGSRQTLWLSTSPTQPLTHWYQVRCLLSSPIFAQRGQVVTGSVVLHSNKRQSYDVEIELVLDGTRTRNTLDLKNPFFRYAGQPPQPPPGCQESSPSEAYWQVLTNGGPDPVMNGGGAAGDMMDVSHQLGPSYPSYNLGEIVDVRSLLAV